MKRKIQTERIENIIIIHNYYYTTERKMYKSRGRRDLVGMLRLNLVPVVLCIGLQQQTWYWCMGALCAVEATTAATTPDPKGQTSWQIFTCSSWKAAGVSVHGRIQDLPKKRRGNHGMYTVRAFNGVCPGTEPLVGGQRPETEGLLSILLQKKVQQLRFYFYMIALPSKKFFIFLYLLGTMLFAAMTIPL